MEKTNRSICEDPQLSLWSEFEVWIMKANMKEERLLLIVWEESILGHISDKIQLGLLSWRERETEKGKNERARARERERERREVRVKKIGRC